MRAARFGAILAILLSLAMAGAQSASAVMPRPGWTIDSPSQPTNFSADENAQCLVSFSEATPICDAYQVTATNAGAHATDGGNVRLWGVIPTGLTVQRIALRWSGFPNAEGLCDEFNDCGGSADLNNLFGKFGPPLCTSAPESGATVAECNLATVFGFGFGPVEPDATLIMTIYLTVEGSASDFHSQFSVTGGGGVAATTSQITPNSSATAPFGLAGFDFHASAPDGTRDLAAGDHPYELTTTIDLASQLRRAPSGQVIGTSTEDLKDVVVDLPLGFAGSTLAAPQCTLAELSGQACPADTIVGHLRTEPDAAAAINSPIYNLVPERGFAGEFGYIDVLKGSHVFYVQVVPSPAGYVLQVTNKDIPQVALSHIVATFYGEPAVRDETGNANIPFFTNPTGCASGPMKATIYMDSWQHPGRFNADGTPDLTNPNWVSKVSESPPVTGCNVLQFTPELKAQTTTNQADSPSGLEFEMKLPQTERAGVPATPALKTAVVNLPEGMTVDPSAAQGLAACSVAQIGWLGGSPFNFTPAQPECPESSKIGSLELTTPLIPGTLTGAIYLARQNENPFGSVLAAYVVVDDPVTGVLLKIAGEFKTDPHTGRLTAVFAENPQLPFSDLKLHFFGGPRAELATPENCGTFTTSSDLAPWSAPDSGLDASPFDNFQIDEGCVNGFAPKFEAGTMNLQAGAFTPFVASFSRSDSDQDLGGLSVTLPPGLLAKITGVPLCPDADASAGTCPEASMVGTVRAGAGPGPNPLFVTGKAYLTGPYKGGPYGLSVVVPAIAGPFDFGTVVVRQSLRIDPTDAHVTDVSDPFPTILNPTGANGQTVGILIKLRRIDVSIDRPGFTFNPTSCAKLQVGGSLSSVTGASSALATPFQVTNCATLKFAPKFSVSTSGKTSKANGASLTAKLSYPNAPQGTYANITKVKVELPKQLPSRLTTLQKACTNAQFESNPAACPAASIIGHATVRTPLLPLPLSGPAYFVSHGGEAFPSLTMILEGNGVTVKLVGTTFINKAGVTSTTFKTVPDVPFNTFELTLPEGRFSALAANGNLCAAKLRMPSEFLAQNGALIRRSTPITVTGCAKKPTRAQKLAAALRACREKANKGRRAGCVRGARRRYRAVKTT
jgi:hypothetical protein